MLSSSPISPIPTITFNPDEQMFEVACDQTLKAQDLEFPLHQLNENLKKEEQQEAGRFLHTLIELLSHYHARTENVYSVKKSKGRGIDIIISENDDAERQGKIKAIKEYSKTHQFRTFTLVRPKEHQEDNTYCFSIQFRERSHTC